MSDLWKEKLQAVAADADEDVSPALMQACTMALDTLAAQAAEIKRLQAQVQSAALDYLALDGQASEALAEAERLRAALAFLRPSQWEEGDISGVTFDARWLADHIDAALEQKP